MENVEIDDNGLDKDLHSKYETLCIKCSTSYIYTFNYYPCHTGWSKALFISKIISAISLTIVGTFILLHKKFSKHPYPLMGWACIAQAIFYYNLCEETIFYTYMLFNLVTWPFGVIIPPLREHVGLGKL